MAYTDEPRGLAFVNNLNTATFGSLVTNACWFLGSTALTVVACILLLRQDGPSLTGGIPTSHEAQRQLGFALAGILLGAWTGKTVAGVTDSHLKRKVYSTEKVAESEAKVAEAKATEAVALAATAEHPVTVGDTP